MHLVRKESDPAAGAEAAHPGADFGDYSGRFNSGDQFAADGLRSRYGQQVAGMNRERADMYLQLTQSRWVRFANLGDFEYFCRVAGSAGR